MTLEWARVGAMIALSLALGLAPGAGAADAATDCSALPKSARRPRPCNPQEECLKLLRGDVKGPARAAARTDCARLPTSGTCYGPDTYDPQAECRAQQRR